MMWKIWIFCGFLVLFAKSAISNAKEHQSDVCRSVLKWYDEILEGRLEKLILHFDSELHKFRQIEKKLDMLLAKGNSGESNCPGAPTIPANCAEALAKAPHSGIHSIKVESYGPNKFPVYCDATTQGGGWTVIQRRLDGSVDFLRNWTDYKAGFGNLHGEFFIGLDKLHALTMDTPQELLIVMEDFDDVTKYAKYDAFVIGNEDEGYALNVLGSYSGDAGDSLTYHASYKFSTPDRDNDVLFGNCAAIYNGAWWFKKCHQSNLNGLYLKGETTTLHGIVWYTWKGFYYSLKSVQMLIRPKRN